MLKNNTVIELLKKENINANLKQVTDKQLAKPVESAVNATRLVLHHIREDLIKYLIEKELKIKYLKKTDIKSKKLLQKFEEMQCLSFIDLKNFLIQLIVPETFSNLDNIKHVMHNISHEIGHCLLDRLIDLSKTDNTLKKYLIDFITASETCGSGVSDYADKYMKGIYGKIATATRIFEIELKHTENFCEIFRIDFEYKLDCTYNKVDFKEYINDNYLNVYEAACRLIDNTLNRTTEGN